MNILKALKKIWKNPDFLKANFSYSQQGEDIILSTLFKKNNGFYVDVGAYDPARYSNTKIFYDRGWNGINIEPDLRGFKKFTVKRRRDLNFNYAIGTKSEEKIFYMFNERALNTFSNELAQERMTSEKMIKKLTKIKPLAEILDEAQISQEIDFMTIDVEGWEMEVLKSNNWHKYLPRTILVEIYGDVLTSEAYAFLKEKGYNLYVKLGITSIFNRA